MNAELSHQDHLCPSDCIPSLYNKFPSLKLDLILQNKPPKKLPNCSWVTKKGNVSCILPFAKYHLSYLSVQFHLRLDLLDYPVLDLTHVQNPPRKSKSRCWLCPKYGCGGCKPKPKLQAAGGARLSSPVVGPAKRPNLWTQKRYINFFFVICTSFTKYICHC